MNDSGSPMEEEGNGAYWWCKVFHTGSQISLHHNNKTIRITRMKHKLSNLIVRGSPPYPSTRKHIYDHKHIV